MYMYFKCVANGIICSLLTDVIGIPHYTLVLEKYIRINLN